jgi:peptidoglycan/LPS O-acetylase OafA/YrhL
VTATHRLPAHPHPVPLIDLGKAVASQLIVWHHLTLYSPMRQVADPLASSLFAWLADPARMVVQLFLVMAGYLAARSLLPGPGAAVRVPVGDMPAKLWQRYLRLAPTYLVAIALAVASAALARSLSDDASIPAAPSAAQLWANVLLLQDVVGLEAVSAGLWYVAIDLQLYLLLLVIAALRSGARRHRQRLQAVSVGLVLGLVLASLLWFNRQRDGDMWGLYFFGSYGLGILAAWVAASRQRWAGTLGLALLVSLALAVEWRTRIAVAGVMACGLAWGPQALSSLRLTHSRVVRWLARVSYSVFLAHYSVCLLVGTVVNGLWPDSVLSNLLGMVLAWALSLGAGWLLHVGVETRLDAVRGFSRLRGLWAGVSS